MCSGVDQTYAVATTMTGCADQNFECTAYLIRMYTLLVIYSASAHNVCTVWPDST